MIYQTISVCPKTKHTIKAYGQLAIQSVGVGHKNPQICYLQLCEDSEAKCSREASLNGNKPTEVSWEFETSKNQKTAQFQVYVFCPLVTVGHINTVYLDQIAVN
jgi:hypothetical protein